MLLLMIIFLVLDFAVPVAAGARKERQGGRFHRRDTWEYKDCQVLNSGGHCFIYSLPSAVLGRTERIQLISEWIMVAEY